MLALPASHTCLGPFCRTFSLGNDAGHTSAERLLAGSVSLGLGIGRRSLQVAASRFIVLGASFGR